MNYNNQNIHKFVWNKLLPIGSYPIKKDKCGATIKFSEYGNRNSKYGWEVDHINPNGGDGLNNLQALQWENNVTKSNKRFYSYCVVSS